MSGALLKSSLCFTHSFDRNNIKQKLHVMPQDMKFKCLINNSSVSLLSLNQCKENYLKWQSAWSEMSCVLQYFWFPAIVYGEWSEVSLIICSYFTWTQLSKHWRTLLICFSWIIDNNYVTWKNIYHYIFIVVDLKVSYPLVLEVFEIISVLSITYHTNCFLISYSE